MSTARVWALIALTALALTACRPPVADLVVRGDRWDALATVGAGRSGGTDWEVVVTSGGSDGPAIRWFQDGQEHAGISGFAMEVGPDRPLEVHAIGDTAPDGTTTAILLAVRVDASVDRVLVLRGDEVVRELSPRVTPLPWRAAGTVLAPTSADVHVVACADGQPIDADLGWAEDGEATLDLADVSCPQVP